MKKSFMSISVLVISISVVAMLLFGSVAQAQTTEGFVYDKKENTETVFTLDRTGCFLTPKVKYELTCNQAGEVVAKEAYRWNASSAEWVPSYRMDYTFADGQQIIDYGVWNRQTEDYSLHTQRAIYEMDINRELLSCNFYKWNSVVDNWDVYQQLRLVELLADQIAE